ncbi:MAG: glutamate-1-semialdehyde 2,1-aminomutase, partial [Verrucomicrobia bacterium]|nr:glutamate-1-semialdehyde 2,1-aminomutase [Verrucomicrobiota bacterium]
CFPSIEQVRFVNSGTEAAMSALRLSRGYTGRNLVVKFIGNYHGHVDALLVQAGSGAAYTGVSASSGVSAEMARSTLALPFNDVDAVERCFKSQGEKIAAVIVEPIAGNMGVVPGTFEFLSTLRKKTKEVGAVLIFDEVITGFRVAKGGAQELYKIQPDVTLLGKILGGGLPAAAFGGKRAIMEHLAPLGAVYQAGTLCGNPLAMAAGLKQLELLEDANFYQTLEQKSRRFLDPIAEKLGERGCIQRVGSMFTLFWGQQRVRNMAEAKACDFEQFKRAFRFFFNEGLYFPPSPLEAAFLSTAHRESELDRAQHLLLQFLA